MQRRCGGIGRLQHKHLHLHRSIWVACTPQTEVLTKTTSRYTLAAQQGNSIAQYNGKGGPVDYAAAATWWKRATDQGYADAITNLPDTLTLLFPSGTRMELVKMSAPRLNGLRGVVDATPDGKIVYSGVGKIAVMLEGGRGTKAVLFENLVVVPPTEAEEKRRKKKAKAKRQKAKKTAGGGSSGGGSSSAGGGSGVVAAGN